MVHIEQTIDAMIFSMYITTDLEFKSFVMFGGYDEELIKEGTNIVWMQTYNDFLWEIHLIKAKIGDKEVEFEQDIESPRTKVLEFDPNQHFIYLDDEDFGLVADILNTKFRSSDPICGEAFCAFENDCDKVGLDGTDFKVTIANSVRYGTMDIDLEAKDLFVDGYLLEEG